MNNFSSLHSLFFYSLLFLSCQSGNLNSSSATQGLVAEVYDRQLYAQEIRDLIPDNMSISDSISLANAYVEQWIRESLLLREAEINKPKELDLDQLIEDYRRSLLKYHYENKFIEDNLDSVIVESEINAFYEQQKEQYILNETIYQVYVLIFESNSPSKESLKEWWNKGEWETLQDNCQANNCKYLKINEDWFNMEKLTNIVPIEVIQLEKLKKGESLSSSEQGFEILLKILDIRDKNKTPPLNYIQDQITKVILHKRKEKILKELMESLYEKESRKNNVKVYAETNL